MKVIYNKWSNDSRELSVSDAIDWTLTPDSYSYSGHLEKLQAQNEKLKEMLVKLVTHLGNGKNGKHLLKAVLESGMEIEE